MVRFCRKSLATRTGDLPRRMSRFTHFACIDWSGAAGERHRGIAAAICDIDGGPPRLLRPGHRWSRGEMLDWLGSAMPDGTLAGLDLGMSLPFIDTGAFFPGWNDSPATARELWRLVDDLCAGDDHFAATGFVTHFEASRYFRHRGVEGDRFGAKGRSGGRGRLRVTEHAQQAMGCNPYSNFNLVGAAQVGKSSLTGMRILNRLPGCIPVWPVDPLTPSGSVVVEIYTSLAAIAAGRSKGRTKLRSYAELNAALAVISSPPVAGSGPIDDHASDALVTAAWLRNVAHRPEYWHPAGMSREIAQTEGWTFGAL